LTKETVRNATRVAEGNVAGIPEAHVPIVVRQVAVEELPKVSDPHAREVVARIRAREGDQNRETEAMDQSGTPLQAEGIARAAEASVTNVNNAGNRSLKPSWRDGNCSCSPRPPQSRALPSRSDPEQRPIPSLNLRD